MDYVALGLGVLCAVLAVALSALSGRLKRAQAALAEAERRAAAPKPPRVVEGRGERCGLLWFPQLAVDDLEKKVLSVAAGRPYCPKCLVALTLLKGPPEEWACAGCSDRRVGTAADLQIVDQIAAQCVHEFTARNPGYRAAPDLPQLKR